MKIIQLHTKQSEQIKKASKGDREAQQALFEQYSPKMLGVCRQYVKDIHHAEDLMLQGFFKVFTNLNKFKMKGALKGGFAELL